MARPSSVAIAVTVNCRPSGLGWTT